jgi:thiamine pyrophosphokinase
LSHAVIVANGEIHNLTLAHALGQASDLLIAADGGSHHCQTLGLTPHILIGDLDSTPPETVAALERAGTRIIQHPVRKDQTDLELAIEWAIANGASGITILGALGGRWDQTLANLLLPTLPAFGSIPIRIIDGSQQITAVRGPGSLSLTGAPGETVSLIPVGGPVHGITTVGLEYPLTDGTLQLGSTLGVSNSLLEKTATITTQSGLLVCVHISTTESL